jgi:hypothetical protein
MTQGMKPLEITFYYFTGMKEVSRNFHLGEHTLKLIMDAFLQPCGYDIRGNRQIAPEMCNTTCMSCIALSISNPPEWAYMWFSQCLSINPFQWANSSLIMPPCEEGKAFALLVSDGPPAVSVHFLHTGCTYWNEIWYTDFIILEYLGQVLFWVWSSKIWQSYAPSALDFEIFQ